MAHKSHDDQVTIPVLAVASWLLADPFVSPPMQLKMVITTSITYFILHFFFFKNELIHFLK